jgi:DnaJ-class molecular chaperone
MRSGNSRPPALACGILLGCVLMAAATVPARAQAASYVGVDKCKLCHLEQYNVWKSTRHSHALEALGDSKSKPECLPCHTTAVNGSKDPSATDLSNVQCEACHGPGSRYKNPLLMSKGKFTANREQARQAVVAAGLVLPDEKVCLGCHNSKSPTFKGFDYASSREKIKHWK